MNVTAFMFTIKTFPARYSLTEFVMDLLKDILFGLIVLALNKLGRIAFNLFEPYLTNAIALFELFFHYFASRLELESPMKFFLLCIKYQYSQKT